MSSPVEFVRDFEEIGNVLNDGRVVNDVERLRSDVKSVVDLRGRKRPSFVQEVEDGLVG